MSSEGKIEDDLSYFACLIDSRSVVYMKDGRRIGMKLWLTKGQYPSVIDLCNKLGFKITYQQGGPTYWVTFLGEEVGKILANVHPHLRSPLSKSKADLAFRFYRTAQKSGVKLTDDQRKERETIYRELLNLRKKARV